MNIGQGIFPILNSQQTNPTLSGLQEQIIRHLSNQQAKLNNQGISLQNQAQQAALPYVGDMAYQNDLAKKIANQFAPQLDQANLNASTQSTLAQKIANQFAPQNEQAKLNQMNAQADYYKSGGFGSNRGAQNQDYQHAVQMVSGDNPQLKNDPSKLDAAAKAYSNGSLMLPDGTMLNKPSTLTQASIGKLIKYGTTSPLLTQQVGANQADKELGTLYDIQKDYLGDYGTTLAGKSPQAIMDSFKNDDASQESLGKFIAGQQLNYEGSQLIQRIASKPTVSGMNEILNSSQSQIKQNYPRMSQKARLAYMDAMKDALTKILESRNQVGIQAFGQAGVSGFPQANNDPSNDPLGIL